MDENSAVRSASAVRSTTCGTSLSCPFFAAMANDAHRLERNRIVFKASVPIIHLKTQGIVFVGDDSVLRFMHICDGRRC